VPVVWATLGFFFPARSEWFLSAVIGDHGRNLVISLWPGDKATINGVAAQRHTPPRPRKFRVQKSAGQILASIFWDENGFLLVYYLPKGQTNNVEYYLSLLMQLKAILKEKRGGKVTKGILFLHDNALAYRALATQKKLAYVGFQCLDHPPYSPDLAPLDYHLFPGLKKTIESSPFFVRRGGHCCRRDLVGQTTFWNLSEWLAKVRATG